MKEPILPGVIDQIKAVSPEAIRAQRMAELQNIAAFRSRHASAYAEWSKPEAVKARYEEYEKAAPAAIVRVIKLPTFTDKVKVTEIHKSHAPKTSWFMRLKIKLGLA